jgi:hypothetical protein
MIPAARGSADWETVCAEVRKSPSQGVSGVSGNHPPDAQAAPTEAHEALVSRETVAEVPLTGLSLMQPVNAELPSG